MVWLTRLSRFTLLAVLAVALTLGLAVNVPAQVPAPLRSTSLSSKLENAFRAPQGPGAPTPVNTEGGGTRAPCFQTDKPLLALLPAAQRGETVGMGETAAEYPSVFWYMPKISPKDADTPAPAVEFVLTDANKQEVYSARYPLAKSAEGVIGSPGIMHLTVANIYPLEIGQEYHWELTMKCDYKDLVDRSRDVTVSGGLKRVEPDPTLARRIQQATPQERVALYAEKRLWNETLASLIELRRANPNDRNLADAWKKLLSSVGLDVISKEPIFQGARAFNTSSYSN